ncbi:MAG: hypothetical protein ACXADH_09115 [Candidatus Kariarchaeaceae archaeon]|jgi:O-antigen/teichoic acid export membrane protein
MDKVSRRNELLWFGGLVIVFLTLIVLVGDPEVTELSIATITFTLSWVIMSYTIKRFGAGGTDKDSIQKEIQWYIIFLIVFLAFLVLIGNPSYADLAMAGAAFTLVWVTRSYLVKKFTTFENKDSYQG